MPKLGMEPIRRAEAINAALECISEHGIQGITLDMVAEKAGFSKGIVAYYFKSKRNLILESLKEFLAAYSQKIGSSIKKDMPVLDMVKTIVEVSLPPIAENNEDTINVSTLEGADKIRLPQKKIAKIFIQFISISSIDDELKTIMRQTYKNDVEGISQLLKYAKKTYSVDDLNEHNEAYALLALINGLSFFRISDFMPFDEADNRNIALEFINRLFRN
jgi:Transcriptional regulator